MRLGPISLRLPAWKNVLLAFTAAIILILAFPDFDYWFLAWIAPLPLLWAIDRERGSVVSAFILGWIFGVCFFFGTCWWLAYAPIHYAAFPAILAYFLVFIASSGAAIFPAVFAAILSFLLRCLGRRAFLAAPFVWVFSEFARYWFTGNNWNAIGYSQAFASWFVPVAQVGGVLAVGFVIVSIQGIAIWGTTAILRVRIDRFVSVNEPIDNRTALYIIVVDGLLSVAAAALIGSAFSFSGHVTSELSIDPYRPQVIAIQPNVPMSGLTYESWLQLRKRHVELAEKALANTSDRQTTNNVPATVIFPESPMNFAYAEDEEFRRFISNFAAKYNVNVLFNSAEPDRENRKYFNSAVFVDTQGRQIAEYDKIYLLPFGEAVPVPLDSIVPAFVGSFSYGKNYNLIPLGDAKAGIMICFESHFGGLSREYVRRGADVIIEMTNDGYLGPTPVLRQHLANAIFRAVETNRPVLRVTNVGITGYINERGEVLDPAESYTEATRVWSVSKSGGSETFFVRFGDWIGWLSAIVTLMLLIVSWLRQSVPSAVPGG
jgi:apolipoprotein N-acyltransferase